MGLLLGSRESHEDTPYVFVDGALEMDSVTEEGEKVVFTEDAWKKAYQDVEQMFPKRTVQGWFLCGGPGSVSYTHLRGEDGVGAPVLRYA